MKWTFFLLGFAIGLWISVVMLLLRPAEEPQPYYVTSETPVSHAASRTLWIPSGDAVYRCTVNDQGGAVVEDQGRAVVDDQGRPVVDDQGRPVVDDQGRPVVDDVGGGVVLASAAHTPAPNSTLLGDPREYQEFWCGLNSRGGPIVMHRNGRVVAVAMAVDPAYQCERDNGGNAVVVSQDGFPVEIDQGGAIVEDQGRPVVDDSHNRQTTPDGVNGATGIADVDDPDTLTGANFVYCMVAKPDSLPTIVNVDGTAVSQ